MTSLDAIITHLQSRRAAFDRGRELDHAVRMARRRILDAMDALPYEPIAGMALVTDGETWDFGVFPVLAKGIRPLGWPRSNETREEAAHRLAILLRTEGIIGGDA